MLNASNPGCFTENNPGTAASGPGSCAGAGFKETAGSESPPRTTPVLTNRPPQHQYHNYDTLRIHGGALV